MVEQRLAEIEKRLGLGGVFVVLGRHGSPISTDLDITDDIGNLIALVRPMQVVCEAVAPAFENLGEGYELGSVRFTKQGIRDIQAALQAYRESER